MKGVDAADGAQIRRGAAAHTALNAFAVATRGASRFVGEIARAPAHTRAFLGKPRGGERCDSGAHFKIYRKLHQNPL